MLLCMCPCLCLNVCVLMFECMCPHVSFFRSKSRSTRQATRHRWGQVRQRIPDTLAGLEIEIDGKEGRKRFNFINNVVKIFNEFVPPEELLYLDRCEHLERAIETVNREIPVTDLFFDGQSCPYVILHVSICFCACVLMFTSLCPYTFMPMSLCYFACVLMLFCMYPHAYVCLS